MTFDLGVWQSVSLMDAGLASRIYNGLCRGEKPTDALISGEAVEAFYQELTTTWPEPAGQTRASSRTITDTPWAASLKHTANYVLMSCDWSHAEITLAYVGALAAKHGLTLFNPQSEEVFLPEEKG